MDQTQRVRRIVVPDIRYTPSCVNNARVRKHFTATLKYYTYRDDKDGDQIVQDTNKFERWNDRGLGQTWRQIQSSCEQYASKHVTAWSLVLAPAPDLFSLIDKEERHQLMREYTDNVIAAYFEARGLQTPEYAFVIHEATTKATEENTERYPFTHSHIVIPGSIKNEATDERLPFYNNSNKGDIELLHDIAEVEMETLLDCELAQEQRINWRFLAGRELPAQIEPVPSVATVVQEVPVVSVENPHRAANSQAASVLDEFFPRDGYLDTIEPADVLRDLDPDLEYEDDDLTTIDFDIDDD